MAAPTKPENTQAKQITELVTKAMKPFVDKLDTVEKAHNKLAAQPVYGDNGGLVGNLIYAQPRDKAEEGMWGFKSFSHWLHEIKGSGKALNTATEFVRKQYTSEFVTKAATGMGELVGSDGGFLVPPTFSDKIFERVYKENDLLGRTDSYTVTGNSMVFPRNAETSRATGSRFGGVRAYWVQEGSTITASAPTFGQFQMNLHKLACLARVTEELLTDSGPALEQYLTRAFTAEINFLTGNSLIRGTGAGQPLGILNADCTVSVAKETGQDAATVVPANIVKMWARRFNLGATGQYVWFINQDVGPQLHLMTLGIGTAGVVVYMPPGGLSDAPYGTLMGAPIIETEWNSTLGTVGDIILADMSQMVSISKGGMNSMSSMHVYFTTDEQAFKTTFRLDAQPWWNSALTPFQGSNTQSPFVSLATRA